MPRRKKPLTFEQPIFFNPAAPVDPGKLDDPILEAHRQFQIEQEKLNKTNSQESLSLLRAMQIRAERNEKTNGLRNIYRKLRKGN